MQENIKVMIVDDHNSFRQGIIALLKEYNFQVFYQASNGRKALDMLKETEPDVILLDLNMPVMNGFETLQLIKRAHPSIKTIVLTGHYDNVSKDECLKQGADAFLAKNCDIEDLILVINTITQSDQSINYLNEVNRGLGIDKIMNESNPDTDLIIEQKALTTKEVEVLIALCDGKSRKAIADELNVTPRTITFHIDNIYKKAKITTVVDLLKYAVKNGYISL